MTLSQLLEALCAEKFDRIIIYHEGSAKVYTGASTFHFTTLADLEKNFAQPSTPSTPSVPQPSTINPQPTDAACTCDQAQTLLRECLRYLQHKFPVTSP